MFRRHQKLPSALIVLTGWVLCFPPVSPGTGELPSERKDTIAAITYLGEVDCVAFPESQDVLLDNVENHEFEDVRYAAAKALFKQLQRGRKPLNPLNGWREIPDPFILEQITLLATFREPWTTAELTDMYAERKLEKEREAAEKNGRKDLLKGCYSDRAMKVLNRIANIRDDLDCWVEPSERVRKLAEDCLIVTLGRDNAEERLAEILARHTLSQQEIDTSIQQLTQSLGSSRGRVSSQIGFAGRADTANRFNLIDGISAAPRSRAWVGFQFISSQNNATVFGSDVDRFFSEFNGLDTIQAQNDFIQATGFGLGITPGFDPIDVFGNPATNEQLLRNEFFSVNTGGKTEQFLRQGDTNLYRFGFEYAVTPDFSFGMQAQYITPLDDAVQQPDTFSNPLVVLKHVAYRDDNQLLAVLLGVSPQIPQSEISIVERTTRFNPGLIYFKESELDDRWFLQAGTAFSLPTNPDRTTTWDWALGVGHWLYRHESLINPNVCVEDDQWLLGIVPQFEVLGKHVMGDTTVRGAFGLIAAAPQAADGFTSSRTDASGTLLFADGTSLSDGAFVFEEPRHVVDLTAAVSFIFRDNWTYSAGISFPVTGGDARATEFLTTLSRGF